jgi:hypothetical protein
MRGCNRLARHRTNVRAQRPAVTGPSGRPSAPGSSARGTGHWPASRGAGAVSPVTETARRGSRRCRLPRTRATRRASAAPARRAGERARAQRFSARRPSRVRRVRAGFRRRRDVRAGAPVRLQSAGPSGHVCILALTRAVFRVFFAASDSIGARCAPGGGPPPTHHRWIETGLASTAPFIVYRDLAVLPHEERAVTAQGYPRSIFKRAVERGNLFAAETTAHELGRPCPLRPSCRARGDRLRLARTGLWQRPRRSARLPAHRIPAVYVVAASRPWPVRV